MLQAMTSIAIPRWLRPRRSLVLPLATAGLAALLPWRAADLLQQWHGLSPISIAVAQAPAPAPPQAADPPPPLAVADIRQTEDGKLLLEIARRKNELDRREQELQTGRRRLLRPTCWRGARSASSSDCGNRWKSLQQASFLPRRPSNLLVGLYSNMKPIQAAAVLELEAPKAAAILARLDTRSAGPILAGMEPKAALAITEELEQRHAPFRR